MCREAFESSRMKLHYFGGLSSIAILPACPFVYLFSSLPPPSCFLRQSQLCSQADLELVTFLSQFLKC